MYALGIVSHGSLLAANIVIFITSFELLSSCKSDTYAMHVNTDTYCQLDVTE